MDTRTSVVTLLVFVIGFALSFEIARRKNGLLRSIVAYLTGFAGAFLTGPLATLFEMPGQHAMDYAPLAAFIGPAVGVLLGRSKSGSTQHKNRNGKIDCGK